MNIFLILQIIGLVVFVVGLIFFVLSSTQGYSILGIQLSIIFTASGMSTLGLITTYKFKVSKSKK